MEIVKTKWLEKREKQTRHEKQKQTDDGRRGLARQLVEIERAKNRRELELDKHIRLTKKNLKFVEELDDPAVTSSSDEEEEEQRLKENGRTTIELSSLQPIALHSDGDTTCPTTRNDVIITIKNSNISTDTKGCRFDSTIMTPCQHVPCSFPDTTTIHRPTGLGLLLPPDDDYVTMTIDEFSDYAAALRSNSTWSGATLASGADDAKKLKCARRPVKSAADQRSERERRIKDHLERLAVNEENRAASNDWLVNYGAPTSFRKRMHIARP